MPRLLRVVAVTAAAALQGSCASAASLRRSLPSASSSPVTWLRGGSTSPGEDFTNLDAAPVRVTVLTAAGSPHLDLKTRFEVPTNCTVAELKSLVEERMAGRPPKSEQRLVLGTRVLSNGGETVASLLAPVATSSDDEFDEFDEFDDDAGSAAKGALAGGPRELSLLLDMLPPLPADKSTPAALEAKLKAYAAEMVAVRFLGNKLRDSVQTAHSQATKRAAESSEREGSVEAAEGEGDAGGLELVTGGLREEIRLLEAHVLTLAKPHLEKTRSTVHRAVVEDGRVAIDLEAPGPWKAFERNCRHHMDVEWRGTLRNVATCMGLAKFGAHGPKEARTIKLCALGLILWQIRPVRLAMKIAIAFASQNRDSALVDLLSTLLPTSHQALLEAEAAAEAPSSSNTLGL